MSSQHPTELQPSSKSTKAHLTLSENIPIQQTDERGQLEQLAIPLLGKSKEIPLTPKTILSLQRTIGNRAVSRLVTHTRTPASVQRAMYLHNQDDLIYKDSANPNAEYAYITKGQSPWFIPYANVTRIQNNAYIAGLRTSYGHKPLYFNRELDDIPAKAAAGDVNAMSVINDVGGIYSVNGQGNVVQVPLNLGDFAHQMIIAMVVRVAYYNGARYWYTGGGSRLPHAQGLLFYSNKHSKATIKQRLNLTDADLANVQLQGIQNYLYSNLVSWLHEAGYTNLFPVKIDPMAAEWDAIYVSTLTTSRSLSSRVTCNGRSYRDDLSDADGNMAAITNSFNRLAVPVSTGWVQGTNLTTVDRGEGQMAARDKWNALGAAAYANRQFGTNYDLNQNWEWLHIQGAQIGGQTIGSNLVPGLFVTNSLMIPYENMIKQWAQTDPTRFWAKFEVLNVQNRIFPQKIRLSIKGINHQTLGDLTFEPFVEFDPISGRIVDKVANEVLKRNLDLSRRI